MKCRKLIGYGTKCSIKVNRPLPFVGMITYDGQWAVTLSISSLIINGDLIVDCLQHVFDGPLNIAYVPLTRDTRMKYNDTASICLGGEEQCPKTPEFIRQYAEHIIMANYGEPLTLINAAKINGIWKFTKDYGLLLPHLGNSEWDELVSTCNKESSLLSGREL